MSTSVPTGQLPHPPRATYRLQFNLGFTFSDAERIVPYLHELGISDLYASPYLQARPGSLHGYDISDHNHLNPELGNESDHSRLMASLRERGMGHLLDIVPNHMGIGVPGNRWWMDVLENGQSSPFAPYFDIDWRPLKSELTGKVLLPVLGDQFGQILERGELKIFFHEGRFRIAYHEQIFPVSPRSSALVLRAVLQEMSRAAPEDDPEIVELESIVTALENLPPRDRSDPSSVAERRRESFVSRRRLLALREDSENFRTALDSALAVYNGTIGNPRSFDPMEELLQDQPYRLAYWRVAAEEINYRRFFDINELAGVRVELDQVFLATHQLILRLVAEGKVTSLRIDHPDGLYHPYAYLKKLQEHTSELAGGRPFYILVEKILTGEESLPEKWPVAGTVGYEFMNRVNGVFVDVASVDAMTRVYERFIRERTNFGNLIYDRKKLILRVSLASELNVLAYLLNRISEKNRRFRDFTLGSLTDAIRETVACFPVYRTYIEADAGGVEPRDALHVDRAIQAAVRRNRAMSRTLFQFLREILLLQWPDELDDDAREEHELFVMKFQQLTGPVMAKGVEDTGFYIYNRLISLCEVGGEPERFGLAPEDLHLWLRRRAEEWPLAMSSSSTHDTKRSEDVRARINILSELPEEWEERVHRWAALNAERKEEVDGDPVPDANDEYLLYQSLIGAWPLQSMDREGARSFRERIGAYMEKATREAKVHTSWINPNEAYDAALRDFISRILEPAGQGAGSDGFIDDFTAFQERIARAGMRNALGQTLVKLTAPGVPDLYQGQELWDFSLVDPDNRRPVDYELRRSLLEEIRAELDARGPTIRGARALVHDWKDGRIKMYVTHVALRARAARETLFARGDYAPLHAVGEQRESLFAFARCNSGQSMLVVVPRLTAAFGRRTGLEVEDPEAWGDTAVVLPREIPGGRFRNLFTGEVLEVSGWGDGRSMATGKVLGGFPVALLEMV